MNRSVAQLTKQQIERQDFVDNKVFELINSLLPPSKHIEWDIEVIGAVRDVIQNEVVKKGVIDKKQFFPYLKIKD